MMRALLTLGISILRSGVGAWTYRGAPGRTGATPQVHQAPIAYEADRPSSVIRFRMVQASRASASCTCG